MEYPKITHIITDLNGFGGAEATLLRYLQGSVIPKENHQVIVLKNIGIDNTLGAQIVAAGFSVVAMGQSGSSMSLGSFMAVYRELKHFQSDLIIGWLYHPCLVASLLTPFLKHRPVVIWHILSLPFVKFLKKPGRFVVQRLLAGLSYLTNPLMLSNSSVAMKAHEAIGFRVPVESLTVIPNGIDVGLYAPNSKDRFDVRQEFGIPNDAILVGCVGRFVPEKGYHVMFDAMARLNERLSPLMLDRVHFLGVGNGVNKENEEFISIADVGFPIERMHFLDKRADVPRLFRALDIFVLSSISEAFPNVLIEAMASGLACLSTDVGQTRDALSMPEYVIAPSDPVQLADRLVDLIELDQLERSKIGEVNRLRVVNCYDLPKMIARFDELFLNAAAKVKMP